MRRLIGCLLMLAVLLQVQIPSYAIGKSEKSFNMMLTVLSEVGIISIPEDTEFDRESAVTRAEFSEWVGKMMNIVPAFEMQYFDDVPHEQEQSGYINTLTDYGVISLNDEKTFAPERTIRYAEACKMLLCAMGYGDYAATKGAPMDNYVQTAAEVGISITAANPDALKAEEAIKMIFKAMKEPIMVTNFDGKTMSIDYDSNLFSKNYNIYFETGLVQATYGAYLERFSMQTEGTAIVGGNTLKTAIDLSDHIGTVIEYAYRYDEDDDSEIIYATLRNQDDIFKIESMLLDDFNEDTDTFYYYETEESSRTKKQRVDKGVQIIYNGVPYDGTITSAISGFIDGTRRGEVILTDSNKDGDFDVVRIKSYEIFPGGSIDTKNENIYGGFEKTTIHYTDYDVIKLFDSKGNREEISDCSETVFGIARSANNEVMEIIMCADTAEMSIKKRTWEDGKVEDREENIYKIDSRVLEQYATMLLGYQNVKVHFDMYGYIVKLELGNTDDFLVGYLVSGKSYAHDEWEAGIELKIYTRGGKIEKYNFAERVRVDNISYRMNKNNGVRNVLNNLPGASSYGEEEHYPKYRISPQVIRYKLNEDNQITALDTITVSAEEDPKNSLTQRHNNAAMLNTNRIGLDTYWSTSETAVFKIPVLNSEGKILLNGTWIEPQAKDFGTSVTLDFDGTYTVDTYNFSDDSFYTDIMIIEQEQATLTKDVLIYTGSYTIWDEFENEVHAVVECYGGGSKLTYKLDAGIETKIESQGLKAGDLFYITLDGSGEYGTDIKKIFDMESLAFVHNSSNDYWYYGEYNPYSNWSYRTGESNRNNLSKMYVLKKRGDAVFGTYEYNELADDIYEEVIRIGSVPVVMVDEMGNVEKATFNSILSYEDAGSNASLILVEIKNQVAKSVIIYR